MAKLVACLLSASLGASVAAVAGLDPCGNDHPDQQADLFVLTQTAPIPVNTGELLTYTIIVRNQGPDPAQDAEVLLLTSDATTFRAVEWTPAQDWQCVHPPVGSKGKVSCTSKCFAPFEPVVFTVAVAVDVCTIGMPIAATTTVFSATADPYPINNVSPSSTPVIDAGACDDGDACTVGDGCTPIPAFGEEFDSVPTPAIPAGWTTTLVSGPPGATPWRTVRSWWNSQPNSAFAPDAPEIRDMVLDSPEIPIRTSAAQLTFRTYYDLERNQDGGVLEIQIGAGPFVDILEAGGSFVEGGYNGTITDDFGSPIANREAWTGAVPPFTPVAVTLPALAAGRTIVLRWRLATDRLRGVVGMWVDSIHITDRHECRPGPLVPCDDGDVCTDDTCDAVGGCRFAPRSCDDGVPCTVDVCNPFTGCTHSAPACDDGNPCTDDACDGPICLHMNNALPCDDGNACTLTDLCSSGVCSGSNAIVCVDADRCTADACDPALRCVAPTADFDGTGFSAGRVDGRDLAVLAEAWNSCPGNSRYDALANLDRDGICIELGDFHRFMDAFGLGCP